MGERIQVVVVAALISWISLQAVAGSSALSGPVVVTLSDTHGVHLEDILVTAAWLLCMVWCLRQWRRCPPRRSR